MSDDARNIRHKLMNNRDTRSGQSTGICLAITFTVLILMYGISVVYAITQSSDTMKVLPNVLAHHTLAAIVYAFAYSKLVAKGLFSSFYFLVAYHLFLGTLLLLHAYLYYLVAAAMRGGAPYPGWLYLTSVKNVANSHIIWYAIHMVFLRNRSPCDEAVLD